MRLKWKFVSVRLEIVLILMPDRCPISTECTIGLEIILDAPDGTLSYEAQVDACFVYLEIELMFTQDRCPVCAEIPQVQKSFWTHPIELLGDLGHVKSHFGLFGDSVR